MSKIKGIILAGGKGSRLDPLTRVTNKHLLPIYNRPMINYPINTLVRAGVKDIMIVAGDEYVGHFLRLLGTGRDFGCKFTYEVQRGHGGIAAALSLTRDFAKDHKMAVILGDNIYEDDFSKDITEYVNDPNDGARIFLKECEDANRFGVAELDQEKKILNIEEKPKNPKTNFAVTGFYLYDHNVYKIIDRLEPSDRGELEITDVNNWYIKQDIMKARFVDGDWTDSGTFESLYRAGRVARKLHLNKQLEAIQTKINQD